MNVELYIEQGDNNYVTLDLFNDESINIQFKLKDSSDLSKVYSTFSKTFNVPTSEKNTRLLNYYFNTEVVRDSSRYIKAKIYINKQLFKVGFIVINEGKFKYLNSSSYSINFFTSLTNLKEVFGDELLKDTLSATPYEVLWEDGRAFLYTQDKIVNPDFDPDLIVPLASTKRVWSYESGTGGVNNIRYTGTNTGVRHIEPRELRPAILFSRIINDLAISKNLVFNSPLFGQDEYEKLYVWCNSSSSTTENVKINSTLAGSDTSQWDMYNTPGNFYFTLKYNTVSSSDMFINLSIIPINVFFSDNNNISMKAILYNFDTGEVISQTIMDKNSNGDAFNSLFIINSLQYNLNTGAILNLGFKIESSEPVYWNTAQIRGISTNITKTANIVKDITTLNLFDLLPEIKTIDFISSFIKMFNISIIEDSVDSNIINFIPRNTFYEDTLDYTDYLNVKEHVVKPTSTFKKINFKHKTSKFKSNEDYKVGFGGREYGELKYESTDVFLKDEYKVETKFSIVPNRLIADTKVQTFYGFLSNGTVDATYGTLYKPNIEDFTIFYYNGSDNIQDSSGINISFNFKVTSGGGAISIQQMGTYNKVSIVYDDNPLTYVNSLGFKDEVDVFNTSFVFEKNMFTNYYKNDIDRIYNPNSRLFEYSFVLPKREINNFSLDKLITIKDKRFTIEEADINITNGVSKLVLMNVAPTVITDLNYIPTAPTTFTATLL